MQGGAEKTQRPKKRTFTHPIHVGNRTDSFINALIKRIFTKLTLTRQLL